MSRHFFSKFKSIEQFRHIVSDYNKNYNRSYNSETKEVVIDRDKPKETLKFYGTTKVHGTNAMILIKDGVYGAGKRTSVISLDEPTSHFGFSAFASANEEILTELMNTVKNIIGVDASKTAIYGEWAGGNVQKNVGVTGLPNFFYIFDFKEVRNGHHKNSDGSSDVAFYHNAVEWYEKLPIDLVTKLNKRGIIFAPQVKTWVLDIDMNSPMRATAELEKLTLEVEAECPVAKFFGKDGIGEGIVWISKRASFPKIDGKNCGDFTPEFREWLSDKTVEGVNNFQVI